MGRSTHCGGNRNAAAASTVRLRFINEPLRKSDFEVSKGTVNVLYVTVYYIDLQVNYKKL